MSPYLFGNSFDEEIDEVNQMFKKGVPENDFNLKTWHQVMSWDFLKDGNTSKNWKCLIVILFLD